jgi:large subunit ribosomal protein L4
MKTDVIKLDAGKAGSIDLDEAIFGLDHVPTSCTALCVTSWQNVSRAHTK